MSTSMRPYLSDEGGRGGDRLMTHSMRGRRLGTYGMRQQVGRRGHRRMGRGRGREGDRMGVGGTRMCKRRRSIN